MQVDGKIGEINVLYTQINPRKGAESSFEKNTLQLIGSCFLQESPLERSESKDEQGSPYEFPLEFED